ncbi:MAG: hypothetical protein HQM03_06830 [Magnetococcales bacterium]|nr:hypothetical protein [Magnetococcales bacterium]
MLQLIPYGLAVLVGGMLGKKVGPRLVGQMMEEDASSPDPQERNMIRLLGESLLQEQSVVLATEDVPLDNRFGNKVLISEHEFIRTATVGLTLGQNDAMAGQLKTSMWSVLDGMLQQECKKNLNIEIGSEITRKVKISFSTEPGRMVRYRVIWKQDLRKGVFDLQIGSNRHALPYVITFGLSHAVESIE